MEFSVQQFFLKRISFRALRVITRKSLKLARALKIHSPEI